MAICLHWKEREGQEMLPLFERRCGDVVLFTEMLDCPFSICLEQLWGYIHVTGVEMGL